MCGLMLAFIVAAALWQRRRGGGVARVDFSMIEAMLWTMAEPLLAMQCGNAPAPQGDRSDRHVLHGAYRCAGDDAWVALAVGNDAERARNARRRVGRGAERLAAQPGCADRRRPAAVRRRSGRRACQFAGSRRQRPSARTRVLGRARRRRTCQVCRGVRASAGASGEAPGLGADTDAVLAEVLGLSGEEIAALRESGALG